jgi:hypothetical protein
MDEDGTNLSWRNVVACHKNNQMMSTQYRYLNLVGELTQNLRAKASAGS